MKKFKAMALAALMAATAVFSSASAFAAQASDYGEVITDVLPNGRTRVTGSKTTSTLPANTSGTQGVSVYTATVQSTQVNASFSLKVSNFSNSMSSVNASVFVGDECIGSQMNMTQGTTITFKIPSGGSGKTFKVVMSTNSTSRGTCEISVY